MCERKFFVAEGDWGGQIYLTAPVGLVEAVRLKAITIIVDAIEWACNDGEGAGLYEWDAELAEEEVSGGMGGGLLTEGLWFHPDLRLELRTWATTFLLGKDEPLPKLADIYKMSPPTDFDRLFYSGQKWWKKLDGARRRAVKLLREEGNRTKK